VYEVVNGKGQYTQRSLLLQDAPATCSQSKAPSSVPTISCKENCCGTNVFLSGFASLNQTKLNIREQAPGENLLGECVVGASSCLVSTLGVLQKLTKIIGISDFKRSISDSL